MKYRIKVITLNDGTKKYVPQVKTKYDLRWFFPHWCGLNREYFSFGKAISIAYYSQTWVDSIDTAKEIIANHKEQELEKLKQEVSANKAYQLQKIKKTEIIEP